MKNMTKQQETALFGPEDHKAPIHKGKHTPGPWGVELTKRGDPFARAYIKHPIGEGR
jgi:hypothetical protein